MLVHTACMTPEPNQWNSKQASAWLGIPQRQLLDLLDQGVLPGIAVGAPHTQKLKGGIRRRRRAVRWIIPREALMRAWQTFTVQPKQPNLKGRRRAAA
jgi:hypothetical protein